MRLSSIQEGKTVSMHGTQLTRLDYPWSLIDSVISNFISSFHSRNPSVSIAERNTDDSNIVRSLPFKDQVSPNAVRRQLHNLSNYIGPTLQPALGFRTCSNY